MFYDVPASYVKEELRFRCVLEPSNARNANSIRLNSQGGFSSLCSYLDFMLKGVLLFVGREVSAHFAPIWISC